jgi:multidrug efflux pump subunit AcrB
VVSLTLTPMMSAQLLRDPRAQAHGRLYLFAEASFDRMLALYDRGLRWVLRHRVITPVATAGTVLLTVYLYVIIPKGFFPQQDTGFIVAVSERRRISRIRRCASVRRSSSTSYSRIPALMG